VGCDIGAREEGGVAMGTGFINIYSKLNENIINAILSLSLYLCKIKIEAEFSICDSSNLLLPCYIK